MRKNITDRHFIPLGVTQVGWIAAYFPVLDHYGEVWDYGNGEFYRSIFDSRLVELFDGWGKTARLYPLGPLPEDDE